MLSDNGFIVIETDEDKNLEDNLNVNIDIYDRRKYGRVKLLFLKRRCIGNQR